MPADNLENRQNNESIQESWEDIAEQELKNPESAKKTAESINASWDLNTLTDKEIKDTNTAKNLIKQKRPDLNIDWRKDYQIINQAKRIQKEMQALRRFENKKQNFEVKDNDSESVLKSFSYREQNWEIIATINGSQEVHYKMKFTTWNEVFDNKLDPQLKNYLDAITYSKSLYELSFFLDNASIFWIEWRVARWEKSQYEKTILEMRAKAHDLRDKFPITWFFDNPNNVSNFIGTFKGFSPNELNSQWFFDLKKLISEALTDSKDFTFSSYRDFDDSEKLSVSWKEKSIKFMDRVPTCNMEIVKVDDNWLHLKNTETWRETVFNADTFKKAKNAKIERENQRDYIKTKEKEVKKRLSISENTEITWEDRRRIETEMLFDGITNDKKIFDLLYNNVAESNARWFSGSIDWEDILWLLKKFSINENINWRWYMSVWNINWKQAIKFDFWNTQIYLWFWEQPKITHKKVTQEEINTKINEEEKSPNYKRALNIIETSKYSWKINLAHLNLTSREVWNLFTEADLKDIHDLEIDLSWNRISTIPSMLLQKEWIKSLDLNSNLITEIPSDTFKEFNRNKCNLEDLSLNWNNINQIPEELFINVNKLKNFWISSKEITKIPDSIWDLTDLQNLNISNTWIETIPDSIVNCKNLETFYADYCKLNRLPNWFGELTKLKSLDLSSNNLSTILDLSKLTNLKHLDISYNKELKSIPEISYDKLETLRITWCDNTIPSIEEFKNNANKLYPDVEIYSEKYKGWRIDTWENIKERYFSWPDNGKKLSWNPNEFFDDRGQYEQIQLIAESLDSGLSKAKQDLWIHENTPVFYAERKRSDWTVSIHVFVKKEEKD